MNNIHIYVRALFLLSCLIFSHVIFGQLSGIKIGIDPGHGGMDVGAPGYNGDDPPYESNFVLEVSLEVKRLLEDQDAEVLITRETDEYVGINDRANMMNSFLPDVYVSIHENSAAAASANYTSTWLRVNPTTHSQSLAEKVLSRMVDDLQFDDGGVRESNDNSGMINVNSAIAACITEGCFISNEECWDHLSESYNRRCHAISIFNGIIDHLGVGNLRGCSIVPAFVCRGCETDLTPICNALNVSTTASTITVSQLAVEELGAAGASNFSVDYYLSTTGNLNNSILIGSQSVGYVGGNEVINLPSKTFNMPSITGDYYYLIVVVDGSNSTGDVDMSNNICFGNGPIYIGGTPTCYDGIQNQGEFGVDCGGPCPACSSQINLTSQACAAPVLNGNQLNVFYDITNFGSSASGNFWVGYFASKLGDITPYPLNIHTQHASINGNTSQNLYKSIDLPSVMSAAGLTDGEYRIGIYIDNFNNVIETNEDDNYCIGNNYFNYTTVNLTHASSCLTTENAGEYLNVYFDMINTGSTNSGIVEYQLFVWDNVSNQYYTFGSTYGVTNIPANDSVSVPASFHLETEMAAHGLAVGFYEIGVYIDYTSLVNETNENDNFCLNTSSFVYTGECNSLNSSVSGNWNGTYELTAPEFFVAPGTGDECIVPATAGDLTLYAGGFIDLQPGFVAEYGSHFQASISECSNIADFIALHVEEELLDFEISSKEHMEERIPSDVTESIHQRVDEDRIRTGKNIELTVSPNPFMDNTTISYSLVSPASISLVLLDINGKIIEVLEKDKPGTVGVHTYELNRNQLVPGTYILKLTSSNQTMTKKLFVVN